MRPFYRGCGRNSYIGVCAGWNSGIQTEALEADARYDEIGSALKIKQIQTEKKELLESLEMYYRVFFLGDITEDDLKKVPHSEE